MKILFWILALSEETAEWWHGFSERNWSVWWERKEKRKSISFNTFFKILHTTERSFLSLICWFQWTCKVWVCKSAVRPDSSYKWLTAVKQEIRASLSLCCANGAEHWVQDMQLCWNCFWLAVTPGPTGTAITVLLGPVELLGATALPHFLCSHWLHQPVLPSKGGNCKFQS